MTSQIHLNLLPIMLSRYTKNKSLSRLVKISKPRACAEGTARCWDAKLFSLNFQPYTMDAGVIIRTGREIELL